MRRKVFCVLTVFLIMTVGCISGCGGCSCDDEEDMTARDRWIQDMDSQYEDHVSDMPSEDELGAPVYPDNVDPSSISPWSSSGEDFENQGVSFNTSDGFEAVVSWYKGEMGEPETITQLPNGHYEAKWNIVRDGRHIEVTVTCTDTGAHIEISNTQQR